jgi:hypothetical protein
VISTKHWHVRKPPVVTCAAYHSGFMTSSSFRIHAMTDDELSLLRSRGTDRSGNPLEALVADGGEPLRCCLRPAEAGESLLLFGWQPSLPGGTTSPYLEVGAVLTHAERCPGPESETAYPAGWRGKPQVLRAYDGRGWIHDATRVHDGSDPERVIADMFADPEVAEIHSRNIAWGCYMFRLTRA